MSNFENNRTERKEKIKQTARETLGKTVQDLGKATYTVMVLGSFTSILGFSDVPWYLSAISIILGGTVSYMFIRIGNKINQNKS